MASVAQRQGMQAAMRTLVAHRAKVGYVEQRPMPTRNIATMAELETALAAPAGLEDDCSGTCKLIARLGGLPPPDGIAYAEGIGNTETFYNHLPKYRNPNYAQVGAFVFFGEPDLLSTQHLACVSKPGADPIIFSHGGHGIFAAHFVPLSVESRYHVGSPVFLSIHDL